MAIDEEDCVLNPKWGSMLVKLHRREQRRDGWYTGRNETVSWRHNHLLLQSFVCCGYVHLDEDSLSAQQHVRFDTWVDILTELILDMGLVLLLLKKFMSTKQL